jgi:hypothetical protein
VRAGVRRCQILFLEKELEIGQESHQRVGSHEIFLFPTIPNSIYQEYSTLILISRSWKWDSDRIQGEIEGLEGILNQKPGATPHNIDFDIMSSWAAK